MNSKKLYELERSRFTEYQFIKSLLVERIQSVRRSQCLQVSLILSDSADFLGGELRVIFNEVRDLSIGDLNGAVSCELRIVEIPDYYMGKSGYRVIDWYEESISLRCADFDIK